MTELLFVDKKMKKLPFNPLNNKILSMIREDSFDIRQRCIAHII